MMNQLTGEHLIEPGALRELIEARDLQVRSGLGKDPQVVATAAARRAWDPLPDSAARDSRAASTSTTVRVGTSAGAGSASSERHPRPVRRWRTVPER